MKQYILSITLIFVLSITVSAQEVVSGDCNNGTGTFKYQNGAEYTGQWKNGKRQGKGKITYPRNALEENLGPGPVVDEPEKPTIPEHILALRQRILDDVNHYGIDYMFFHGAEGMLGLVADAERVGEYIGHNKIEPLPEAPNKHKTIIRDYFELAKKIIRRAEDSQRVDTEAKNYYYNLIHLNYIRNLCKLDMATGLQGMRDYANTLRNFQDAERLQIEADNILLMNYQKTTQDILETVPYVDKALSIIYMATGEDLTGQPIKPFKRWWDVLSLVTPTVLDKMLDKMPKMSKALSEITERLNEIEVDAYIKMLDYYKIDKSLAVAVHKKLAQAYGLRPPGFDWAYKHVSKIVTDTIKKHTTDELKKQTTDKITKPIEEKMNIMLGGEADSIQKNYDKNKVGLSGNTRLAGKKEAAEKTKEVKSEEEMPENKQEKK